MKKPPRRRRLTAEQKDKIWAQALSLAARRGFLPVEVTDRRRAVADPAFARILLGEQPHTFIGSQCATCSAPAPYLRAAPATMACWEFYHLFLTRAETAPENDLLLCLKGMSLVAKQGQIGYRSTWEP